MRNRIGRLILAPVGLFLAGACVTELPNHAADEAHPLPTEAQLSREPALARQWADRLEDNDPRTLAAATTMLAEGGARALPLLKRFLLEIRDEHLRQQAFELLRRIGPDAIPLLTEALRQGAVSIRREAVSILIDLAPDTEKVQPALRRALADADSDVAGDAARALGALGAKAGPSLPALATALSHANPHVRIYAAEAVASIGPPAAAATRPLTKALRDPVPGVRWAACEALAGIGPAASSAVPRLIEALQDDFLYVRICAAGALGSMGPKAVAAAAALKTAASDPVLRPEAEWALKQIAGPASRAQDIATAGDSAPPQEPRGSRRKEAQVGKSEVRSPKSEVEQSLLTSAATVQGGNTRGAFGNSLALQDQFPATAQTTGQQPRPGAVARTSHPPVDWDIRTRRNIVWSVELGNETFGRPVVAEGVVYVGTDNARHLNPAFRDECGVLLAFRASDGQFLWQDLAPRVQRGLREFLLPSTTSAPLVEGNRLYYVTAECQLRCLDTQGFREGENSGPYQHEFFRGNGATDIVWELDLCGQLGVFPHEAANSEVLAVGDLLMVSTSNGQNEGHTRVPSPRAPSLIAVNRQTGRVAWRAIGAGERVLHGQWSSPTAAQVNGCAQVLFGGGDGWLRAYDAVSGREIWRFDGNPKDARWLPRPGMFSRSQIIAAPVYADGRVFVAMGQDPSHGDGPSLLHAVSPHGQGDVTDSRKLWTCRQVGRVVGTPIVSDGLLYIGDLGGMLRCVDTATGDVLWGFSTGAAIWGCLRLAGDRVYAGNVDGGVAVLRAGRQKELLANFEMDAPLYSAPAVVGDALYLATARRLYHISSPPDLSQLNKGGRAALDGHDRVRRGPTFFTTE